ncbi:MAG: PEP-CTERM sorting domain-containing protein [Planctomycetales bacterium]|nr:PEP-CTERM sorting domain-containing protein [Planctomycetales bacterium]
MRFNRLATLSAAFLFAIANFASAADIVWVHQMRGQDGEGTGAVPDAGQGTLAWEDDQWRALLEGAGHTIIDHDRYDQPGGLDVLNSADIVLFSRDTNSGDYNDVEEQEQWTEGVTVPMIILTPYVLRANRWDMVESSGILDPGDDWEAEPLEALVPDHPIFAGALTNGVADIWDEDLLGDGDNIDFLDIFDEDGMVGNGTVLAIESGLDVPWIIYWEEGVEFYDDSVLGFTAAGPRLYYSVGSDDDNYSWGEKNTTAAGDRILLNAIDWMTGTSVGVEGDFNGNGELDLDDINSLTAASAGGTNPSEFDLTGDSKVDSADISNWISDLANSWLGDANLDGEFNSSDFVTVFGAAKYETNQPANWSEGDWNGDGVFSSGDFVTAFAGGGYEVGTRGAPAVPEPNTVVLLMTSLLLVIGIRRR